jgi:hypothetical protein
VDYEWLTKIPPKGLPRLDLPESRPKRPVPPPRNGMTVEKFLKTIGRGCEEYIDKLDWEKLFTSTGFKLKQLGIPIRQRKWILLWVEKYRQGIDPWYVPLRSKSKRNMKLEWRQKLREKSMKSEQKE